MRICQLENVTKPLVLVTFLSTLFSSCSNITVDPKRDERVIIANWNKVAPRFTHLTEKDEPIVHPFFDVNPEIQNFSSNPDLNGEINTIITTPEGSSYQYDLDLYSGKLYRERNFCPQDDIWQDYLADLMTPNFTQGIIPRVLDEAQKPMRAIIISSPDYIENFNLNPDHFEKMRVIGSVILENCESFPCDQMSKWKPTQILVGVAPRDPRYFGLKSFKDLKETTDWTYTKGMLNNMYGTHRLGEKSATAFRVSKELNLKDSYDYFTKNSNVISYDKLAELGNKRQACFELYDSMWNDVEKIRTENKGQQDLFLNFFKNFYSKSSDLFFECQKFVRPATIIENPRRLWFFSYIQAFTLLEKSGFYYSCSDNAWAYNPRVDDKTLFVNQNKELARCRARSLEYAFDRAINGMSLLKTQSNKQFRFVEYDNGRGGSHQKIYGWIFDRVQYFECKYQSKKNQPKRFDIFPQDVIWENFKSDDQGTVR